mgnify:CR=1 FL=1
MEPIIKIDNLIFEYKKAEEDKPVRAIDDISLQIEKGSFTAILGKNGSGKSTLAKNLNGLLLPTSGVIYVNGYDTADDEHIWDVRQSAGMVFQNPDNQLVSAIVEDDVAFGPENLGIEPAEIRRRVDKALDDVNMGEYKGKPPHLLSGGQKQRVAIAGVVAMKPTCIIFDEPTAMLDPNGRKEVLQAAHLLNRKKGVTVILITHYMEEVVDADRVFVMDKGKVVMQGTPREIFSQVDELKRHRLDVPQITLLADELRKSGLPIPAGILTRAELVQELCKLGHR